MSTQKKSIQLSDHFTFGKLIKFVYPSIIMMIFTSIYGVVDGLFVSNFVGKTPFAAINLIMPFIMIFGGIGFMFGTGGTALVAKTLGEGKKELAKKYFTMMIMATIIVGAIASTLGFIFMKRICILLGATEEMLPSSVLYGRITICFNVCFMLQSVFHSFCVTAEKPKLGLYTTLAAGCANMVMDALFVAVFKWGVAGAALATGLSQLIGGVIPLIYFLRPNSSVLRLTKTKIQIKLVLNAVTNGASEMVSNITMSVVGMLYNVQLLKYAGENGVAAYGVLMYVGFIFIAVFIGYSIGSAPIVGFNYGAANYDELKNMLKKSVFLMFAAGLTLFIIAECLAVPLAKLFVGYDEELLELTVSCFRISVLAYIVTGFNIFSSSFFTALNNGLISALISFLRTFVFKLSAVLLLPVLFGIGGIWWAEVVAEIAAFILSVSFLFAKRNKYHYM
ncbi:MAG: MATE family efflux transporter [Clostridia bacterium]|nr:MATE family efflux transporter [Clostridia bacterium]